MAFQSFNHVLDDAGLLKAAGAVNATANGSLVVDVGAGFQKFDVVIDWTECEVATGNEQYDVIVQGATDSGMTNPYELCKTSFGDSTVNGDAVDTPPAGRLILSCSNAAITSATDGNTLTTLRYIRIRTVVAGTVATGFNYRASLTQAQK